MDNQSLEETIEEIEDKDEEFSDLVETSVDDIGILQEDALEYISGYIIRNLNLEEYESHESSFTWVDQVSKGYLKKASNSFLETMKFLELTFNKTNGMEISHKRNLHNRLCEEIVFQMSNLLSCATFEYKIEGTESQAEGNGLQKNA